MLKAALSSLAVLLVLVAIIAVIVVGAESLTIPVTQEGYQMCLDKAQESQNPPKNCPKEETLWRRGFEDPVAYYTFWLALFTVALAMGAFLQSLLIGRQITLARQEFVATHRPKIDVLALRIASDWSDEAEGVDPIVEVILRFVNSGDSPAHILEIGSVITQQVTDAIEFTASKNWNGGPLVGGTEGTCRIKAESLRASEAEADMIHVVGYILYSDSLKNRRKTGFSRKYDGTSGTWETIWSDSYEYSY